MTQFNIGDRVIFRSTIDRHLNGETQLGTIVTGFTDRSHDEYIRSYGVIYDKSPNDPVRYPITACLTLVEPADIFDPTAEYFA